MRPATHSSLKQVEERGKEGGGGEEQEEEGDREGGGRCSSVSARVREKPRNAEDALVVDLARLLGKLLAVVRLAVELERAAGLGAVADRGVELLKDRLVGGLEDRGPVEGATAGSGRAG